MALLSWLPAPLDAATLESLGAEHGIVRARDVQRLLDGLQADRHTAARRDALLARAQAEAEALRAQSRAQAAALLEQAQAQVAQAVEQARAEAHAQALAEWHQRWAEASAARAGTMQSVHERLAGVVTLAVEKIVSVEDRGALFRRALRQVEALSREAGACMLRVCPADEAAARAAVVALATADEGPAIHVAADASLAAGSCRFETDAGVVDASLATQLQALQAAMARAVTRAGAHAGQGAS